MIDQILKEFDEKFTQLCYDSKDANVEFIGFKGNCEKARTWLKEKLTSFEREVKKKAIKEFLKSDEGKVYQDYTLIKKI